MGELFEDVEKKRKFNPVFIIGILVAIAIFAVALFFLARRPSLDDQTAAILDTAAKPGSPDFDALNRDIIIARSDDTVQSPTGLGTISMYIKGDIHNKGTHDITVLQVTVSIVDQMNQVLKQRDILVVPVQQPELPAGGSIPITLTMGGFDRNSDRADIRWKVTAIKAR